MRSHTHQIYPPLLRLSVRGCFLHLLVMSLALMPLALCDLLKCLECPTPVYMICVPMSIYADEPKHYNHLPKMPLVLHVRPKPLQPTKAWDSGRPLKVPCGTWHQDVSKTPCKLQGDAATIWTSCSSAYHRSLVKLRSRKFGGRGYTLTSFSCSSNHFWIMWAV